MVLFWLILALLLAVAAFVFGPYLIEAMVEKIDQWADIIDAF